ncbi:MAG: glutamyl-tRNA reductase [Candidatus Sumerlaeaceae bacterium]|nr:glutamyl-tRNA reductase [Candidatus Sumerlaeaceae bacterium]
MKTRRNKTDLVATGYNHRSAPIDLREQLAVSDAANGVVIRRLLDVPGVHEAAVLSTCNRVEIYTVEDSGDNAGPGTATFLPELFGVEPAEALSHQYRLFGDDAVRHLFSVAAGLDSMILGEPQILGQVRAAYARAVEAGSAGTLIHAVFARALETGKRVRTETGLGSFPVSVPYAAVELARKTLGPLENRNAVLAGRGKMSELTARHLASLQVGRIIVAVRAAGTEAAFAAEIGAESVVLDADLKCLADADIFVCGTTSPDYLVYRKPLEQVMAARRGRPLVMVDISVPRNIDPAAGKVEGVHLFNVDDLEAVMAENRKAQADEARRATAIVDEETGRFAEWRESRHAVPAIVAFREHLERIRVGEVERVSASGQNLDESQRELLEHFSRSLVNKIGHGPTVRLKSAESEGEAREYRKVLNELFGLDPKA